jgi:hypothetical protein
MNLNQSLLFISSALSMIWGIAHLFPTKNVVRGFGDISIDNRHIITMEWIIEGVALIFIGVIVALVTLIDPAHQISVAIFITSILMYVTLALISFFTGFKVDFLPYKLCPFIFLTSAVLISLGAFL